MLISQGAAGLKGDKGIPGDRGDRVSLSKPESHAAALVSLFVFHKGSYWQRRYPWR